MAAPTKVEGTMINSNKIRGLHNFISDIRSCPNKEAEAKRVNKEMANIRNKFKEKSSKKSLSGYHRKKYVAKIMYMYMLGYDVDFGYIEAIRLLNEDKFSEKQIGYLSVQLMLSETHDMQPLIINSMQNDLHSRSDLAACLALTAIANIGSREMAEQVANIVLNMLLAQSTKLTTKKKSAACLMHLWRRNPESVNLQDGVDRLINLVDPSIQLGFSTALFSLLIGLSKKMHDELEPAVARSITLLDKLVTNSGVPRDYIYYGTPAPWLQVLILRFLRQYPLPHDPTLRAKMIDLLKRILVTADSATQGSWNTKNARNMVLFEAIDLAVDLNCDDEIMRQVSSVCASFITAKESNIRYLGLEALAHLSAVSESAPTALKKQQDMVISQLKDNDISIRRRALDLLYGVCDRENSHHIVSELLHYLQNADYDIREELVVKIAILAEKFAANYAWYVDIILQLISIAGDHVHDEIWHRVVRVVINHEELQEHAAKTVFAAVQQRTAHETTVRVAAYILGEFGHLIADNEGSRPADQFRILHSKLGQVSPPTKASLLSTFDKFVNLYPEETEVTRAVLDVLRAHSTFLDAEIQQRAVEYLSLANNPALMAAVWDVMPPFPEEEAGIPHAKRAADTDRDNDLSDASTANATQAALAAVAADQALRDYTPAVSALQQHVRTAAPPSQYGASSPLDMLGGGGVASFAAASAQHDQQSPFAQQSQPSPQQQQQQQSVRTVLSPKNQDAFNRLCLVSEGVLYEDEYMQIGLRSAYQQSIGRLMLYFGNTTQFSLLNVSSTTTACDGIAVQAQPAPTELAAGVQGSQALQLACVGVFTDTPSVRVSFQTQGQTIQLNLGLPVVLTKFMAPLQVDKDDFFARWKSAAAGESQLVIKSNRQIDLAYTSKVFSTGFHLACLEGVDNNPHNLVAAGTFHSQSRQLVCLVRLESNQQAQAFRLTVRSFDPSVTTTLASLLQAQLGEIIQQ